MAREQNRPHLGPEGTMFGCEEKRIDLDLTSSATGVSSTCVIEAGMLAGCRCQRRRLIILSEFHRTVQFGVARQDLCLFQVVCPSGKQSSERGYSDVEQRLPQAPGNHAERRTIPDLAKN